MTTVYAPDGIPAADIVATMGKKGIVVAGGLHKDIKSKHTYKQIVRRSHLHRSQVLQDRVGGYLSKHD